MWLYKDIASTPSSRASLRIESDSIPPSSASRIAASSTRSRLSGTRGCERVFGFGAI